ncbi:hypothetical protein ACLMJK_008348 [Lecanora helva]
MKRLRVEDLVMSCLFASRREPDPNDWQTHVRRNLVHEVRAETVRFYGPTDCIEAQYPGLDYNNPAHRLRLGHFPYHRRLFRAFDQLRLSDNDIQALCKWEGTRYAKEVYEANNRRPIRDTTWDGVQDVTLERTTATQCPTLRGGYLSHGVRKIIEATQSRLEDKEMEEFSTEEEAAEEGSEDEIQHSIGVELNQRLLAATEARARGEDVVIDAAWERWLKEAAERDIRLQSHLTNAVPSSGSGNASQTPEYWGREIMELVSDNPTSEITALQASLSPPAQYFSREVSNTLSTTALGPSAAPPTGTAL